MEFDRNMFDNMDQIKQNIIKVSSKLIKKISKYTEKCSKNRKIPKMLKKYCIFYLYDVRNKFCVW